MTMILEKIQKNAKLFLGVIVLCVVAAITLSQILPEKFEAKVTVRSATVGQVIQSGQTLSSVQVEPNTQTLSRLSSPSFYTTTLLATCEKNGDTASEALSTAIKATIVKQTTDLTALVYRAKGFQQVKTCMQAIVDQLAFAQEELAKSRKKLLKDQLALRQTELAELNKIESELRQTLSKNGISGKSPSEAALYLSGLLTRRNQTDELRRIINDLVAALGEPSTQPLRALEPIYVSPHPVFPNPFLFAFVGLFFGMMLCAALCWRELLDLMKSDESD